MEKKKKPPKSPEERAAKQKEQAEKRKAKIAKKETQIYKLLQRAAKKAKDFEIGKLKRRLLLLKKAKAAQEAGELQNVELDIHEAARKIEANNLADSEVLAANPEAATIEAATTVAATQQPAEKLESRKSARSEVVSADQEAAIGQPAKKLKSSKAAKSKVAAANQEAATEQPAINENAKNGEKKFRDEKRQKGTETDTIDVTSIVPIAVADATLEKAGEEEAGEEPIEQDCAGHADTTLRLPIAGGFMDLTRIMSSLQAKMEEEKKKLADAAIPSEKKMAVRMLQALKHTSMEDQIAMLEAAQQIRHIALAHMAGKKLGLSILESEAQPGLSLNEDPETAAPENLLELIARRMLHNNKLRAGLGECEQLFADIKASYKRWQDWEAKKEKKHMARLAAQAKNKELAAEGKEPPEKPQLPLDKKAKRGLKIAERKNTKLAAKRKKHQALQGQARANMKKGGGIDDNCMTPRKRKLEMGKLKYNNKRDKKRLAAPQVEMPSKPKVDANPPLHPSWTAKKQQSGLLAHIPAAQGKKVTFAD